MYLQFQNLLFPIKNFKKLTTGLRSLHLSKAPRKSYFKSGNCSGVILHKKKNFKILECNNCEYIHIFPKPTFLYLNKFYSKKYYQIRKPDYFKLQKKSNRWWKKIFKSRLELFEKFLGKKGSILDIGCGPGFFLNEAKKSGWKVKGIEPSEYASNFAKKNFNLNIINCNYEDLKKNLKEKFDVLYSHGVLEHIIDPCNYFKNIGFFLKKRGLLYSSTANEFNILQMLYMLGNKKNKNISKLNVKPWFLTPPEHINYFNHNSIAKLYKKNKFDILNQTSTFPIELFLLSGFDYLKDSKKGKISQRLREGFESYLYSNFDTENFSNLYKKFFFDNFIGRQTETLGRLKE